VDHNTPKSKLEKLRLLRDAKFDEIVSCLSEKLYLLLMKSASRAPQGSTPLNDSTWKNMAGAPISGGEPGYHSACVIACAEPHLRTH
jgi:hypothetical protein